MCSVEEGLKHEEKLPAFYRRYVDDTLTIMPDVTAAISFLNSLNHAHDADNFTIVNCISYTKQSIIEHSIIFNSRESFLI